ncbi:MAG: hypothetical protein HC828_21620, partial [Blastochloris sp.]|nr:hypothetical protein [Blastochloris sp.]
YADKIRVREFADGRLRCGCDPDWHTELRGRLRVYYAKRLQQALPHEQQRILIDYIYLHRSNPVVRPFFESSEGAGAVADAPRPGDWAELCAMVAQHEGEESAQLAAHWFERQPEGVIVFRNADSTGQANAGPIGFLGVVALERATDDERNADPGTHAAWEFLQQTTPLRPGERATMFRFWMERDRYQLVSQVQKLIGVATVRHYLTTPGLAATFFRAPTRSSGNRSTPTPICNASRWLILRWVSAAMGCSVTIGALCHRSPGWKCSPRVSWRKGYRLRSRNPSPR